MQNVPTIAQPFLESNGNRNFRFFNDWRSAIRRCRPSLTARVECARPAIIALPPKSTVSVNH